MKWSKIRRDIKTYICDELKNVIDVQMTWYHKAHDWVWEAFITINKEKVFWWWHYMWLINWENTPYGESYKVQIKDSKTLELMNKWILDTWDVVRNLFYYPNIPFEELIESNNPIFRAFMIVDRRLWKRRFDSLKILETDSELVKRFYEIRKKVFYKNIEKRQGLYLYQRKICWKINI